MKYYNVFFTAKVDCSMPVGFENDKEATAGAFLDAIRDRISNNANVDDWVEQDDLPVITIDDWTLEDKDES